MKYLKLNYFTYYLLFFILYSCSDKNANIMLPKDYSFIDNKSFDKYIILGYNKTEKNFTKSYIEIYEKNNNSLIYKTNLKEYSIENKNVLVIDKKYFYYDSGIYYLGASGGDVYGTLLDVEKLKEYNIHIKIGFNNIVFAETSIDNSIIKAIVEKYELENYKRLDIKYDENN